MTTEFRLLSKRQAAKMLGIGRSGKLERLIADGHIRVTMVYGDEKIALGEIERFVREGTEPAPERKPTPPPARRGPDAELARVMALK